jgi:P pilus assembly chaperone PapD
MGVPIFIEAQAPKAAPSVSPLVLNGRQLTFSLKNSGTAHMRVKKVLLTAKSAAKTVHTQELPAWYLLAGGIRTYAVTLPDAACQGASTLEVKVESDKGSPKASLAQFSCGP